MTPKRGSTTGAERAFGLLAALAHSVAYPLEGFVEASSVNLGLEPAQIAPLARHKAFRRPVNHAASRSLGLDGIIPGREVLHRLGHDQATRLAVVLLVETREEVASAALLMAGGALHRRILRLTLRTDRQRADGIFGARIVEIATREAPVLYARLAELDTDERPAMIFDQKVDAAEAQVFATGFGLGILGRMVAAVDPGLAELFARRFGDTSIKGSALGGPLNTQLLKFLNLGKPNWSDLIA